MPPLLTDIEEVQIVFPSVSRAGRVAACRPESAVSTTKEDKVELQMSVLSSMDRTSPLPSTIVDASCGESHATTVLDDRESHCAGPRSVQTSSTGARALPASRDSFASDVRETMPHLEMETILPDEQSFSSL